MRFSTTNLLPKCVAWGSAGSGDFLRGQRALHIYVQSVATHLGGRPTPPHQKQGLDPSRGSWDFLWGRALHIYMHFGEHPHGRPACGSKALK